MRNQVRIKILLVDDSEICRDTSRMMLEQAGFDVVALESPLGFSKALLKEKPDIALVDVGMPALQGDQLVSYARRHGAKQRCPILLFSAQPERKLAALVESCGADGYIKKSDDWPQMVRSILAYRSRARLADAH